ncbi:hypothetical protein BGX28_008285 [Mortierella sp. GBA30]|nr:hypothetical protein BGX28_008285 [Mortierella sp. GBA30]
MILLVMLAETEAKKASLSILTNNVYFLPEIMNTGQIGAEYIKGVDILVIQECFALGPCDILRDGLKAQYPYQTPVLGGKESEWDSTSGSFSHFALANGGVVVMSKWLIKQQHQYVYRTACGIDGFSNKGFVYAVLDYQGTNVHVFATHMQNDDILCYRGQGADIRADSLDDMRSYIDSRNIPQEELIIIAGDFNIDKDTSEYYSSLLNKLSVHTPDAYEGQGYSWDPKENSLAATSSDGQGIYIDYVFVEKSHCSDVNLVQTLLKDHSAKYEFGGRVFNDFSDHFPVKAVVEWDEKDEQ